MSGNDKAARSAGEGCPDPSRLRAHVHALGFVVIEDVGPEEAQARYFAGRRDGLGTLPFAHLMHAQVRSRH